MVLWLLGLLLALWLVVSPFLALWNLLRMRELERRLARIEAELAARARSTAGGTAPAQSGALPAEAGAPAAPAPAGEAAGIRHESRWPQEGLEARIAGRWLVWTGGVALALAGLFAVALALERGLFGPAVWLSLLALAGIAAFAFALWLARRGGGPVPAVLAAAGLVTVYAVLFAAARVYDLIDPRLAFALALLAVGAAMAAVRALGPALLPLAALGAWAAPVLVGVGQMPAYVLAGWLALVQLVFGGLARAWESRVVAWLLPVAALAWTGAAAATAFAQALAGLRFPAHAAELPELAAMLARDLLAAGGLRAADALLLFAALASRPDLPALWRTRPQPPRALGLPFHLHQLLALFALVAGWGLRGGDGVAFAAALLFTAAGLAAAGRGGGFSAAVIAGALPVLLPLAAPAPPPPAGTAPGLPAPLPAQLWPILLQPAVLALAAAAWGLVEALRGARPASGTALAAAVPLATLAVLHLVLRPLLGPAPFALAALGLAAVALEGTRRALAAGLREPAAVAASATVAALALGAVFWFGPAQWPVALAVIAFAAVVLHARLPVAALPAAACVLAALASLFGIAGLFHDPAAGSLDHALETGLLPLLVLVLLSRTGVLRVHPLRAQAVDLARDLLALALLAQLVAVANGLALSALLHPVLREGLALACLLRVSLALVGLREVVPARVRELWAVPLLPAAFPALALAVGRAAPHLHPWDVGLLPLFDALLVGGLVAAGLAAACALRLRAVWPGAARTVGVGALVWLLGWEVLEVRHLARGALLVGSWSQGEHLAVSLCWLATAGVLFAAGLQRDVRDLRVAGVGVATLVAAKLFLVDLAELAGLYRVAALAVVGAGLLAFGWFERRRG